MAEFTRNPPSLRPMGVGEVLDAGIGLARQNYRLLVFTSAWAVVLGFVLAAVTDLLSPGVGLGSSILLIGVAIGQGALSLACAWVVDPTVVMGGPRPGAFYRVLLGRLASLLGVILIGSVLVIPLVILFPLGIFLSVRWSMAGLAILLDRTGPIAGIRRSWRLTRGSWWHVLGVILVGWLLYSLFSTVVEGILGTIDAMLSFLLRNPAINRLNLSLAITFIALLVTPFGSSINVVLYYELKARAEGFDLILRARRLRQAAEETRSAIGMTHE